jgi:hypothetical protein
MAADILFKFVSGNLYEAEKTLRPEAVADGSGRVLAEILDRRKIPPIVTAELIRQDEIRRGYFVEGLSGVQFALPEALDSPERKDGDAMVLWPSVIQRAAKII